MTMTEPVPWWREKRESLFGSGERKKDGCSLDGRWWCGPGKTVGHWAGWPLTRLERNDNTVPRLYLVHGIYYLETTTPPGVASTCRRMAWPGLRLVQTLPSTLKCSQWLAGEHQPKVMDVCLLRSRLQISFHQKRRCCRCSSMSGQSLSLQDYVL